MKILGTSLNVGTLAAGAGIVLLTPIVVPIVAGILKPVAKSVIKGGLIAYEKSKTATAEELNRRFELDLQQHELCTVAQLDDQEIEEYRELDERRFENVIPFGV